MDNPWTLAIVFLFIVPLGLALLLRRRWGFSILGVVGATLILGWVGLGLLWVSRKKA